MKCPECASENVYADGNLWVCPECAHEWTAPQSPKTPEAAAADSTLVRDSNGNVLTTGDSVTVIKELKIKGASSAVKIGTKVKNIRVIAAEDGHNISCRIDGIGALNLKSEFVKKA